MSPAWTPILDGPDAERARAAVRAIVHALRGLPAAALRRSAHELALLETYLVRADDEAADQAAPLHWLDVATDVVAEQAMGPGLWGGFLGVAWAVEHVQAMLVGPPDAGGGDDTNEDIDAALLDLLRHPTWTRDYDLVSGLCGMGVYALERLPRPAAAEAIHGIVDHLGRLAERTPEGLTFWTAPALMIAETREKYP